MNKIRAQALQIILFKTLTNENDCKYGELLPHSEVQWLSKRRVLKRLNNILSAIVQFFKQRRADSGTLKFNSGLDILVFLVDIIGGKNSIN